MPDVYGGGGGGVLFIVLSTDMTGRTMTGKVAKSMGHASRTNHGVRVLLNLQCLPPSLTSKVETPFPNLPTRRPTEYRHL